MHRNNRDNKAKASPLFSVICKMDIGDTPQVHKTTIYELRDKDGSRKGTASVTRRLPLSAKF